MDDRISDSDIERLAVWVLRGDIWRSAGSPRWSGESRDWVKAERFIDETHRALRPEAGRLGALVPGLKQMMGRLRGRSASARDWKRDWQRVDPPPYGRSDATVPAPTFRNLAPYGLPANESPISGVEMSLKNDVEIRLAVAAKIKDMISADASLDRLHKKGALSVVSAYYYQHRQSQFSTHLGGLDHGGWLAESVLNHEGAVRPEITELLKSPPSFRYGDYVQQVLASNQQAMEYERRERLAGKWLSTEFKSIAPPLEAYLMEARERASAQRQAEARRVAWEPPVFQAGKAEQARAASATYQPPSASSTTSNNPWAQHLRGPAPAQLGSNNPYHPDKNPARSQPSPVQHGAPTSRPGSARSR
ncbi:hypothetical protein ACN28G_26460 [Micromonospora sp. WMMA1923]|uniref:hypothetical protein n=1 Tax=Micromonospora sp. WMMA1923 TaxID=3404125 RepID=UPI003B95102A